MLLNFKVGYQANKLFSSMACTINRLITYVLKGKRLSKLTFQYNCTLCMTS